MFGWLSVIKESIVNLGTTIKDGITNVLYELFVPDVDAIEERFNSILERFNWVKMIAETFDSIVHYFSDALYNEAPVVYMNFDLAESDYDYGGYAVALDMNWYARYKPIVDVFLSAWIMFLYVVRLYFKLPDIINGVGSDFDVMREHQTNVMKWNTRNRRLGE